MKNLCSDGKLQRDESRRFNFRSQLCKDCDCWGDCAFKNLWQFQDKNENMEE